MTITQDAWDVNEHYILSKYIKYVCMYVYYYISSEVGTFTVF